ncbi:hypothetical protein FOA52_007239 [Chlamydomonas sp. UWO 241]|nr:hypothetical protein FOA52_007239 [Chlamydomonas sp. UWO 241]
MQLITRRHATSHAKLRRPDPTSHGERSATHGMASRAKAAANVAKSTSAGAGAALLALASNLFQAEV